MTKRWIIAGILISLSAALSIAQPVAGAPAGDELRCVVQSYALFLDESLAEDLKKVATGIQSESRNCEVFDIATDDILKIVGQAWGTPALYSRVRCDLHYSVSDATGVGDSGIDCPFDFYSAMETSADRSGRYANMSTHHFSKLRFEDDGVTIHFAPSQVELKCGAIDGHKIPEVKQPMIAPVLRTTIRHNRSAIIIARLAPLSPTIKPHLLLVFSPVRASAQRMQYVQMLQDLSLWMTIGKPGVKKLLDDALAWEKLVTAPDPKALAEFSKEPVPGTTVKVEYVSIPSRHRFQMWDPTGRPVKVSYLNDNRRAGSQAVYVSCKEGESISAAEVVTQPLASGKLVVDVFVATGPWTYVGDAEESQPLKKGDRSYQVTNVHYRDIGDNKREASCEIITENCGDQDCSVALVDSNGKQYASPRSMSPIVTEMPRQRGTRRRSIDSIAVPKNVTIEQLAIRTRAYQKITFENVAAEPHLPATPSMSQPSGQ